MVSFKPNSGRIWDPIRARYVTATPEEKVRQRWILAMIGPLGYPKGLLSIEKELPNIRRRFDLICYTPAKEGLKALLLIECKAEDDLSIAEAQVFGYNDTVLAPFLCVICKDRAKTFWKEGEGIKSVPFLPTYGELIRCL